MATIAIQYNQESTFYCFHYLNIGFEKQSSREYLWYALPVWSHDAKQPIITWTLSEKPHQS